MLEEELQRMSDKEHSNNNEQDYSNEFNALQKIISVLQELSQDSREKLLKTVITFFGIQTTGRRVISEESTQLSFDKALPSFSEDRSMSPKEFLIEKEPHTDVEKVACLAYYLTHYRDTQHFKTIDISKLNTEAAQRKFSNATKAIANAMRSGYLVPSTKGHKQLSAAGELFVQALPDRNAAREAMSKAHPRRKTSRIAAKSKNK